MLVLANGAFKSGSSWLRAIVDEIKPFDEIPPEYRNPLHKKAWLDKHKIRPFLESGLHRSNDYLSKGHIYGRRYRDLLLAYPEVYVLDIVRDTRDAIVSHYYHFKRLYKVDWDFERFYWRVGRYKAYQIKLYHDTWDLPDESIYVSSYQRLKDEFETEVKRIGAFIGVDLDADELARIREATSLERMQADRGQDKLDEQQRFFRKGAIGDWREHFDEKSLADIDRIEAEGLRLVDQGVFHLAFSLRPTLTYYYSTTIKALRPGFG